ncbi:MULTISPECIES: type II toxin-antitoxin system RatA family toxin [Haloprofundus]|uniref:type II toxin-antitoxin system RatA family toxin n=1 Tax=Haloprofundus TaxID=1911573 RepID=UPI000E43C3B5|nr:MULTISPECIES: SRPBCC family protein [Haloprofundus]QCJ47797.1 SRPBCC family protein [Haloprofundus sp. MHR1]
MDEIAVSTVVYLPPEEVYEFLVDFPRYANYSKYLTDVRADGDGSAGTEYALRFEWWKLTYTAHSEVTELAPPHRVEWRLTKTINAEGRWLVEPLDELPEDAPPDADTACRVVIEVEFDPDSAHGALDLPMFVSFDRVIEKVKPLVVKEAERVVERVVADLEGRERSVTLEVRDRPDEL